MSVYYVNGAYVDRDNALLPVTDLAILRGYGVFDYLRTYHGEPVSLEANVARLRQSATLIGLDYPWSDAEIAAIVRETLNHNDHPESSIRIVVTGGSSPDNIMPNGSPSLIVMVDAHKPNPDWWYTQGVKIVTANIARLYPGAKSINYIPAILARKKADANAVEVIYTTDTGHVLEGTTSNLFLVMDGKLITPHLERVLPGITRRTIINAASKEFVIEERDIDLDELYSADEAFITAANKRVVPVSTVDDRTIGDGQPGPVTQRVMALFDAVTYGVAKHA
ncbi:MAG: aminotransferase class IV [Anaerolineae bacterium]|nr:aminotransferase class IV [Anaerolineae bacterium]MCA9893114.1 aminotransferase class IV [Anaerolineae bacterium]